MRVDLKTNRGETYLKRKIKNNFLIVILSLIAIIQLYPFIWMVFFSLKSDKEIWGGNMMGLPIQPQFQNYVSAWNQANISKYFFNSLLVTTVSIVFTIILSTMSAYAITRMKWKLKRVALIYFLAGMMIPLHAALLPDMLILKSFHQIDTYLSLIIPYVAFSIPMSLFITTSFFRGVPKEMEEAACIDGAGIYRTFFMIMMPLVRPAIATSAVFTYLGTWNELMFATVYINTDKFKTLTVGIMQMQGQYQVHWGPMGAGLVIASVPTIIIYLLLSKQVQESLTSGAVKG